MWLESKPTFHPLEYVQQKSESFSRYDSVMQWQIHKKYDLVFNQELILFGNDHTYLHKIHIVHAVKMIPRQN